MIIELLKVIPVADVHRVAIGLGRRLLRLSNGRRQAYQWKEQLTEKTHGTIVFLTKATPAGVATACLPSLKLRPDN